MKSIVKSFYKSTIPWEDIDVETLNTYISLTSDCKSIKDAKLTNCIQTPKTKTTLNSYTNPTKNSCAMSGDNQFIPPSEYPTDKQFRAMIGHGIA